MQPSNGATESESESQKKETGFVPTSYDSFDSADTTIFLKGDWENHTMTFWNLAVERSYTLAYDGTTMFLDKYGQSISTAQITPGDIVDVTFLKSTKHLTTLRMSSEAWNLDKVTYFALDGLRGVATVGQEEKKYKLSANTHFFAEGIPIDMSEISEVDTLSFLGIDTEILTVRVLKGHGYLRLAGQEKFIGGWLEIGQSKILRIKEEMLLPLPEGSYHVTISKDQNGGEKTAVIRKNEETVLDISDLEVAEPEKGTILFSLTPSSAKLFVDGEKVDASMPVTLVYGIHQLIIKAEGYQTLTQYVRVGQPSAGLDISLDPITEGGETESSGETDLTSGGYKVYVDAPVGVEVFLDGNYVGITPCSFQKVAGAHAIMLRKTGCQSKSYTVQISEEEKDVSYSFAELETKSEGTSEDASTTDLNDIISGVLDNLLE